MPAGYISSISSDRKKIISFSKLFSQNITENILNSS